MKAVVVGASSGLGRCIGVGLGRRGDRVALPARRRDRLVDAAKEARPDTLAVACDVTDESSCRAAVEEAAAGLGGIDALVYATGIGPLAPVETLDADAWRHVMDTNVIGAALVTSAALPHLTKSGGEGDSRTGFNDGWGREYTAQVYPGLAAARLSDGFPARRGGVPPRPRRRTALRRHHPGSDRDAAPARPGVPGLMHKTGPNGPAPRPR